LAQKGIKTLKKEFLVIGKKHVRLWQIMFIWGVAAGIVAGIVLVANRSGRFRQSFAGGLDVPIGEFPVNPVQFIYSQSCGEDIVCCGDPRYQLTLAEAGDPGPYEYANQDYYFPVHNNAGEDGFTGSDTASLPVGVTYESINLWTFSPGDPDNHPSCDINILSYVLFTPQAGVTIIPLTTTLNQIDGREAQAAGIHERLDLLPESNGDIQIIVFAADTNDYDKREDLPEGNTAGEIKIFINTVDTAAAEREARPAVKVNKFTLNAEKMNGAENKEVVLGSIPKGSLIKGITLVKTKHFDALAGDARLWFALKIYLK